MDQPAIAPDEQERQYHIQLYEKIREENIENYKRFVAGEPAEPLPIGFMTQLARPGITLQRSWSLLEQRVDSFSLIDFNAPPPDFDVQVARLCIAIYLIEKTNQIRTSAFAKDNTNLTSLYVKLSDSVSALTDEGFYGMEIREIAERYLDFEALLFACCEICELRKSTLRDAVDRYKKELGRMVAEKLQKNKASKKKGGKAA